MSANHQDSPNEEVDSFLTGSYATEGTAEHGFLYQKELFLYFFLQLMKVGKYIFKIGFEVKPSKKFDDIVIDFEKKEKDEEDDVKKDAKVPQCHSYHIQTKHDSTNAKVITWDYLLRRDKSAKKSKSAPPKIKPQNSLDQDDKGEKTENKNSFGFHLYHEAVGGIAWSENRLRKFMYLSNYKLFLNMESISAGSSTNIPETTDQETDKDFQEIFEKLAPAENRGITKFIKRFKLSDGTEIKDKYFLENFLLISNLPNWTSLKKINNEMLKKLFKSDHCKSMRLRIYNELSKYNGEGNDSTRDPMTEADFTKLMHNAILETDFLTFSQEFKSKFPNWLKFSNDALERLSTDRKCIFSSGNAKLLAFMLLQKMILKQNESRDQEKDEKEKAKECKIYLILYSQLMNIHKEALKDFDHKVIIFVDEDSWEEVETGDNVLFVFGSNGQRDQIEICSIDDLTVEARRNFLNKQIKYQGFDVVIDNLTKDSAALTNILQEYSFEKETLEIGKDVTNKTSPKYMTRALSCQGLRLNDEEIFQLGENTIILGVGGIGKTEAMKKLGEVVKTKHPDFSVYHIDLISKVSMLKCLKQEKLTFKHNPAQDGENIDVWDFVVNNLLDLGETEEERKLQKSLLEAHVKERQPKIVLFLDGFDKISPLYTDQVVQIINGLKQMKVQMFVSSQLQLQEILQNLQFELNYKIEPFSERMQREFLRKYWKDYLYKKVSNNEIREADIDRLHVNLYTKKFFKMCQKSMLTDTILSVPLMLNILADIYAEECVKFCIKSGREVKEFLEIDILNVYEKIFKDNCKKYSKKIFINVDDPVIVQAEERKIQKWRQIYMAIAAKKLLKIPFNEENVPRKDEIEVYKRNFITGRTVGEHSFIYDTMEEFFAADWFKSKIFPNDGSINVNLLLSLLKEDTPQREAKSKNKKKDNKQKASQMEIKQDLDKGVKNFAYRFILKRLKELRRAGNVTIPEQDKKRISAFIIEFFHQAWHNQESFQLAAIFDMAKMFCSKEQIQDVLKVKKLLETVPFTSSAQLELSVQIHDYYFDPEATNAVLGQRDLNKIMELILKNTNYPLFESLYATMKERRIYSEDDFVTKTFDSFEKFLLKQDLKDRLFAKDLFWWFFEHRQMKQEVVLGKMNKVFEESIKNNKPKFPERHLAGYLLTSFWDFKIREEAEDRNNKEGAEKEFVEGLFKNLKESKNFYRFLYAINCTTREDLLLKSVEAIREYSLDFTCYDGKSVLFHAFSDNNTFLLQNLLKLLHKSEIEAQIKANVCGGTSLTQQCTKGNFLCEVILQELVNKFGSDVVELFFTANAKETKEVEDNLKIFSTFFRKDMKVDEEILKGLANHLRESCNNVEQFMSLAKEISSPEAFDYIMTSKS